MLFFLLLVSPVVVLPLVLVHAVYSYRKLLRRPARLCSYAAVLIGGTAHLVFLRGLTHTPIVQGTTRCVEDKPSWMGEEVRLLRYDPKTFPPEANCVWDDGTTVDMVPGYITPTLYTLLSLTAACAVVGLFFLLRTRRS
ncbi:cytochrome bd-type quinol oxidase subunit 2 [Actinopolyspora lacussalsi]|nr:cytochrome bd-type quinol oxidase subunit 2 [Actinopolyspora lacussalsi]